MEYYGLTSPRSTPVHQELATAIFQDDVATSMSTQPLARALQDAESADESETTTSSSPSSDYAFTRRGRSEPPYAECLGEYPVDWHIAQALISDHDIADRQNGVLYARREGVVGDTRGLTHDGKLFDLKEEGLIRCWHMYTDCECCGLTRYYLRGERYSHFLPPVIKARPPCCFNKVYLNLCQDSSVLITDSKNRCLGLFRYSAPRTLQPDPISRDPEEIMIMCLYENIWWLAHEFCSEIYVAVGSNTYSPAKKPYRTQLAFPNQTLPAVKTNLAKTCDYLEDVYPHVRIIH